jgi:membrane protease YdiL (CAAX protease family)
MSATRPGRLRAYLEFLAAVVYFFLARALAHSASMEMATEDWRPLVDQFMLLFLLLVGYGGFGLALDRQQHPLSEQGLPRREGWTGEVGLGLAVGWALAVACVLPLMVGGGIAIVLTTHLNSWGWLLADAVFFSLVALVEEVAFRGYGFQRFVQAVGPFGASLGYAVFYAILQALLPGSSRLSVAISVVFSLLLSAAYLRSRALWVSWGINFGWKASRALLFGLAISGVSSHSPVVEGDPMGPFWLTGGGFGLDGSWVTLVLLLVLLPVVFRVTRELDYRYNTPVIVPGGIPVDLDSTVQRQHEAAMGTAEPTPKLVQILPAATPADAPADPER